MGKHSQGKTLTVLLFFIQPQMFSVNHGLVDQQYKSTEMLQQKFYCEQLFSTQNVEVFPADFFPYTVCILRWLLMITHLQYFTDQVATYIYTFLSTLHSYFIKLRPCVQMHGYIVHALKLRNHTHTTHVSYTYLCNDVTLHDCHTAFRLSQLTSTVLILLLTGYSDVHVFVVNNTCRCKLNLCTLIGLFVFS